MKNKNNKSKFLALIIGVIALIVIIVGYISFSSTSSEPEKKISKISLNDIKSIEIKYNNGKDFINITQDKIRYYALDDNGYVIKENIVIDKTIITEDINYILNNDYKNLTGKTETKNAWWSVKVSTEKNSWFIDGIDNEPDWYKDLLYKLNVETYGYFYDREAVKDFTKSISLEDENKTVSITNTFTILFKGFRFPDDESDGNKHFRYIADIVINGSKLENTIFNIKDDLVIWSSNYASKFEVTKIDNVYILDSFIAKQTGGHYILVLNTEGVVLNNFSDVEYKLDKNNKKFTITDCKGTCKSSVYQIEEDKINT